MKVAVIGSGGFIGRALTRVLAAGGVEVVPISSASDGAFDENTGVIAERFLRETKLDVVVYLAQSPYYREMPHRAAHLWGVNVVSAIKAGEWARTCGATRFIYA